MRHIGPMHGWQSDVFLCRAKSAQITPALPQKPFPQVDKERTKFVFVQVHVPADLQECGLVEGTPRPGCCRGTWACIFQIPAHLCCGAVWFAGSSVCVYISLASAGYNLNLDCHMLLLKAISQLVLMSIAPNVGRLHSKCNVQLMAQMMSLLIGSFIRIAINMFSLYCTYCCIKHFRLLWCYPVVFCLMCSRVG